MEEVMNIEYHSFQIRETDHKNRINLLTFLELSSLKNISDSNPILLTELDG